MVSILAEKRGTAGSSFSRVGGSSGAVVAAALKYAKTLKNLGQ